MGGAGYRTDVNRSVPVDESIHLKLKISLDLHPSLADGKDCL